MVGLQFQAAEVGVSGSSIVRLRRPTVKSNPTSGRALTADGKFRLGVNFDGGDGPFETAATKQLDIGGNQEV